MNRRALALAMTSAILFTGCVITLHPIYTEKDVIFDEALVGLWRDLDSEDTWRFTRSDDNSYRLVYTDAGAKQGAFHAYLASVQGTIFLDLQPEEPELPANPFYQDHIILAHSFILVEQIQPELRIRFMDDQWLENYLEQYPDAIAHEKVARGEEGVIVLTAPTDELQRFVLKHTKTEGAFGDPLKMKPDE